MPLDLLKKGEQAQITRLEGDQATLERLRAIGLGRGRLVTILQAEPNRPILVRFNGTGTRIAIDRKLAQKVSTQATKW